MSKRSYNLVTNVALLLGIVSAFLYSRIPHEIAVGLASIAGVLAVGAYFYNSFASRSPEVHEGANCEAHDHGSRDIVTIKTGSGPTFIEVKGQHFPDKYLTAVAAANLYRAETQLELYLEHMLSLEAKRKEMFLQHYWLHSNPGRRLRYQIEADDRLFTPEVELSPKEAAACAAHIIRELSSDGKEWDFAFDDKGLRVSRRRTSTNVYNVFIQDDADLSDESYDQGASDSHWKQTSIN